MMKMLFKVDQQTIVPVPNNPIARKGSKKYLHLAFQFSSDWNDADKSAYISADHRCNPLNVVDNMVEVPAWYTQQDHFCFSLVGVASNGMQITTNVIKIELEDSGDTWKAVAPDITDTAYAMILQKIKLLQETMMAKPTGEPFGQPGQYLQTDGIGGTFWGTPDPVTDQQLDAWMQGHPEATTTVQDGSLERKKLSTSLDALIFSGAYTTPEFFGAVGDGVSDDTAAVQSAVDTGKTVVLNNLYHLKKALIIKNAAIMCTFKAHIDTESNTLAFIGSNVRISGGVWSYSGDSLTTDGFVTLTEKAVENVLVQNCTFYGFKNKCIAIGSKNFETKNIEIFNCTGSGSTSASGAVFSVFGALCSQIRLSHLTASEARSGVTVNGGRQIIIDNVFAHDLTDLGITLDGMITEAKDGPSDCVVADCIISQVPSNKYGGIYLGNGANGVTISDCKISDCFNAIKTLQTDRINVTSVSIRDCTNGIVSSLTTDSVVNNSIMKSCSNRGIDMFKSSDIRIDGNRLISCKIGINIMANNIFVSSCDFTGCEKGIGAYYGGYDLANIAMVACSFINNTANTDNERLFAMIRSCIGVADK